MNSPLVTIVVVNWNAGHQLRDCIDSVQKHGSTLVDRIIVVDNGSTDGSERAVQGIPGVTLVAAGENLGFGKACNLGAHRVDSEFLLFLNPDAMLYTNTLSGALDFMQNPVSAKVGICGVQLMGEDGHISRSCTRFPTATSFVFHAVGLDRLFPRLGHFMAEWDHTQTRQVDHVIGAFFLVRSGVFEALAGFDERFFLYLEDLDFSLRARKAGWSSAYLASVRAFHAGGGTSKQIKARRLFYSLRSHLLFAFKHFSSLGAVMVTFASLLIEPLTRSAMALIRRSWSTLTEVFVAYRMLLCWILRIFQSDMRRD